MISNFDERIKFIDCIFCYNQNILSIFLYLIFLYSISSWNQLWWLQVLYELRFYVNYYLLSNNCLLLLMHDLNKLNSLWLYVKLDPFMKKLHIVQLAIISYFWQIIFYASIIVLWMFNMSETLFNLIFILCLFAVTKVSKL